MLKGTSSRGKPQRDVHRKRGATRSFKKKSGTKKTDDEDSCVTTGEVLLKQRAENGGSRRWPPKSTFCFPGQTSSVRCDSHTIERLRKLAYRESAAQGASKRRQEKNRQRPVEKHPAGIREKARKSLGELPSFLFKRKDALAKE